MSQKKDQYLYYNGSKVAKVYYNGTQVWTKYQVSDFTFNGDTVTGYTGSASSITIPQSYYTAIDSDGTTLYLTASGTTGDYKVTKIGADAFANNTNITSVTIPSTIKNIGDRAFFGCSKLSSISTGGTYNSIGAGAFACTQLNIQYCPDLYNSDNLGSGCFATHKDWVLMGSIENLCNKLRATTTNSTLVSADGTQGYGQILKSYAWCKWQHNGGSQSPGSPTIKVSFHISNGLGPERMMDWQVGTDYSTRYAVYNAGNADIWCTYTESGIQNYSSQSAVTDSKGWYNDWFRIDYRVLITTTCLAKGTLITLADDTQKPVEDIKYTDLLKVWNFETGQIDYQYPLMLTELKTDKIERITLEDGSYIDISGIHDIYDPTLHQFVAWGNGNVKAEDVTSHTMLKLVDNYYKILKVKSIETIEKETTCHCCMTGGTITAFANNLLVGSVLLNYAGITNRHSFADSFQNDKKLAYTYDKFKTELYDKSDKYSILGLNLHYAHFYNKDVSNLPMLLTPFANKKPLNIVKNKIQCTIGFLQNDKLTEEVYPEDTTIILPEILDTTANQWYIVGEYRYLNPGDSYTINYSTIIRAVKRENNDS